MKIAEAFVEISARFDKLKQGLSGAVSTARTQVGKIEGRFAKMRATVGAAFDGLAKKARESFTQIGGAITGAATGLLAFVDRTAAIIDEQAKFARRVGVTVQSLREFEHAAELSGIQANQFRMALQRLTRRSAEAAMGTGEAKDALAELGINAEKFVGLSLEDKMGVLADAFAKVTNQADRVRLAFKLFDAEGVAMVQMLENGRIGLASMTAEFRRLNGVVTDDSAKALEDYNDSMTKLRATFSGLGVELATGLAPALQAMAEEWTIWLRRVKDTELSLSGVLGLLRDIVANSVFGGLLGLTPDTSLAPDERGATETRSEAARERLRREREMAEMSTQVLMEEARREFQRALAYTSQYTGLPGAAFLRPRGYGEFSTGGRGNEGTPFTPGPGFLPTSSALDKPLAAVTQAITTAVASGIESVSTAIGGFNAGVEQQIQRNMLTQSQQQTRLLRDIRDGVNAAQSGGAFT